jgi:hypothetical protein
MAARHLQSKGAVMSDIVERLRNWRTVHLARLHLLMEEAAAEIERLRNGAVESREAVQSRLLHPLVIWRCYSRSRCRSPPLAAGGP